METFHPLGVGQYQSWIGAFIRRSPLSLADIWVGGLACATSVD
jgi:hypothetical protein